MYNKEGILVTGATGFLGIHIIRELTIKESNVFCLVRGNSLEEANKKIRDKMVWYFGSEADKILNCVKIICGDFSIDYFGLEKDVYAYLVSRISKVIHTGAIVKHFGKKSEYECTNIVGTRNIVKFCKESGSYLLYTSSVAVLNYADDSELNWSYQSEDKVDLYVMSKMESEKIIVEARKIGVKASIIRIGALFGRYSDGTFQQNISENALSARIKTMIVSGKLPSSFLNNNLDILPVDICSEIITFILQNNKEGFFCLYNSNTITYEDLIQLLDKLGYHIEPKDYPDYISFYNDIKEYPIKTEVLTGYYLHFRRRRNNQIRKSLYNCELTELYLKENHLEVPHVTIEYINKVISYMKRIGYIRAI